MLAGIKTKTRHDLCRFGRGTIAINLIKLLMQYANLVVTDAAQII